MGKKPHTLCARCQAPTSAARSWKTIHEIIKEKFGTPRLKGE